jgi:hypothetical protein
VRSTFARGMTRARNAFRLSGARDGLVDAAIINLQIAWVAPLS